MPFLSKHTSVFLPVPFPSPFLFLLSPPSFLSPPLLFIFFDLGPESKDLDVLGKGSPTVLCSQPSVFSYSPTLSLAGIIVIFGDVSLSPCLVYYVCFSFLLLLDLPPPPPHLPCLPFPSLTDCLSFASFTLSPPVSQLPLVSFSQF